MSNTPFELSPSDLRRPCDPATLGFDTSDELLPLRDVIGQPRALRSLELGSEVSGPGFNIFVMGLPGSGRSTLSREYLERGAASEPIPDDWCYVNNFDDSRQPKALRLPAGHAAGLKKNLQALVDLCTDEIRRAFQSEEYTQAQNRLSDAMKQVQEDEFSKLQVQVAEFSFVIVRTPYGFALIPAADGKPLKPEDIEKLSAEQRARLEQLQIKLEGEAKKTLEHIREAAQEIYEKIHELDERTALFVVEHLVVDVKEKYRDLDQVTAYLDAVQADMVTHIAQLRGAEGDGAPDPDWLKRYEVNVFVDNSSLTGAPVVVETYPSYHNLLGRIEHEVIMGVAHTDFTLIRPGAFHRANGGYLLLPARDVLINAYAWEGLERVLRDGSIRIIELGAQLGLISTVTLEPEPIPLSIKVILYGTPLIYYLLRTHDEDFTKLFKVRAEFATTMNRTPENENDYALFAKSVVDNNQLSSFDNTAVARIIEHGSRLAGNQNKLSTRFGKIADLVREADYWAKKEKQEIVNAEAVSRAISETEYRDNLLEERIHELIAEDTIMIAVEGKAVGQVNVLSVLMLGDYAFGRPNRLTAAAHPGKSGVVDIERQAKLGGPIHTKGVLILTGFLRKRYGQAKPLNLAASLAFEQSYEGVEGDSASAAELIALLSAIADIPLRQDRAVTGSINQHGVIQAVGGINEKIEGFFAICRMKGLTGSQGVIIPAANKRHLMLKVEVVEAVAAGKFHIWPITSSDEGLALLTDMQVGEQQDDGAYPEGTVNYAVHRKLDEYAKAIKSSPKENFQNDNSKDEMDTPEETKE